MAKAESKAPASPSFARKLNPNRIGITPFLFLIVLTGLFLVGCGASPATPQAIQPSDDGKVVLRFDPAAEAVEVTSRSFSPASVGSEQVTEKSGPISEKRYDLQPGSYQVAVTWTEQGKRVGNFEVPEIEAATDDYDVVFNPQNTQPLPIAEVPGGNTDGETGEIGGSPALRTGFSLRGDTSFSVSSLSDSQRLWYERLWTAVNHPDPKINMDDLIASDDEYEYARLLNQYNFGLLGALRVTGDLRFLDEVDRIAQGMRSNLYDGWCGGVASSYDLYYGSTVYEKDGYLNFRRKISSPDHYCRDVSDLEEANMHAHLAMVAYAYHLNRDLPSPSGVDYGERADFWLDYLRNHFEAKWRERSNTAWPDMDFINTKFCHTHNQFTLYHYYVGSILADKGSPEAMPYLDRAREMTDQMFDEPHVPGDQAGGFVDVSTPLGPAVVYAFGTPFGNGSPKMEGCPTTYAKLLVEAAVQLHMEGFYRWADESIMEKIGNGIAHFVMDTDPVSSSSAPLAASVVGNSTVGGIKPTNYRNRPTTGQANISAFGALAAWQSNDKIMRITDQLYREWESDPNAPRTPYIPASMLFAVSFE